MKAHIAYPDAKAFRTVMEALAKIVDEVAMHISQEELRIKAIDPAHIALIEIHLPSTSFIEYELETDAGEVVGGISIANMFKVIKRARKGEKLDIDITDENIVLTITSTAIKKYTFKNIEVSEPEIPEAVMEFKVRALIIADALKNALKDAEAVGDTLEIEVPSGEELIFRGKGAGFTETKITSGSPALLELEVKEASKSAYSVEYLKHVAALMKIADTIQLEYSSQMPIRLQFNLPGEGKVVYLLAPK